MIHSPLSTFGVICLASRTQTGWVATKDHIQKDMLIQCRLPRNLEEEVFCSCVLSDGAAVIKTNLEWVELRPPHHSWTFKFKMSPRADWRSCCVCGKNKKTHPQVRLHVFPKDARRYARMGSDM